MPIAYAHQLKHQSKIQHIEKLRLHEQTAVEGSMKFWAHEYQRKAACYARGFSEGQKASIHDDHFGDHTGKLTAKNKILDYIERF